MFGRSRTTRVRALVAAWLLPAFLTGAAHAGTAPLATSSDSGDAVHSALPATGSTAANAAPRDGTGPGAGGGVIAEPQGEAVSPLQDTPSQVDAAAATVRARAELEHRGADRRARTGLPVTHGTPPPLAFV